MLTPIDEKLVVYCAEKPTGDTFPSVYCPNNPAEMLVKPATNVCIDERVTNFFAISRGYYAGKPMENAVFLLKKEMSVVL